MPERNAQKRHLKLDLVLVPALALARFLVPVLALHLALHCNQAH